MERFIYQRYISRKLQQNEVGVLKTLQKYLERIK
jgi:hypothetical protein